MLLGSICVGALGMENQGIPASHVTSSTTLLQQNKDYSPTQARLNNVQYLKSGIQYQGKYFLMLFKCVFKKTITAG